MKKLFSIIMSLLMVVCFMPTMAFADNKSTVPTSDTTWENGTVITYENEVMTITGSDDAAKPLTITIKGTVTLRAEVELKGYVKLVGDGKDATIQFVDPDTTSSDKAAVGHRAVLKPSANVGASDYDSSCTTFENLILKQDTNQKENVDISPITMQAYSSVVLDNVTFDGWTEIDEKYSIISALNGKLTLKNGVNFSGCGDTKHIAMTPTSPNEGSTQLPIVLNNFSTTTNGGIVLTYGVAEKNYDKDKTTLKDVEDPILFASGATKNNVDNFKFKIRVNLNPAVYLDRQTIYAEGNLYTGSGTVQPDRTKWEIDLGEPTNVTVSGGSLRQFVEKNNGTFNPVTITPSEGKIFTEVNILALTTALKDTGLKATVDDAGAIVISGTPNQDVDLSEITWPTPSSSKTVNLGDAKALEAKGLAVEGNLNQVIANNGDFQDVTIKALDGKMPLTDADVKAITGELGESSPLEAKLSGGEIIISQKSGTSLTGNINVDIFNKLSSHDDVVAKIGDEPYDDLTTAIGAADEKRYRCEGVR